MSQTVIKVENLYKQYRLGVLSHRTLYRDLQSRWSRLRGREDPNSIIGKDGTHLFNERFFALSDVSFEVARGEVLGIIGRNGAGKSTLLKILSKVTMPTRGEVKIKGRIASLLEVGTGFHPELTGRENIFLNGAILGMSKKEIASKFDEIVDFAGIEKFIDTPVKRYSSGMYVRLAFAVAAHLEPEILIIDEVLAVGDAEFQKKCLGKMDDVSKRGGRTIIFVSHNTAFIRSLCSTTILLDKGKLKQIGKSALVINDYKLSFRDKEFNENSELDNPYYRRGSGEAKFSSIVLYNSKNEATSVFETGEDIILKMKVKIFKRLEHLNFSLLFRSPNNEESVTSTPYIPIINKPVEAGTEFVFEFKIIQPNFRTGEFPLYLWLGDSPKYYDLVDKVYSITIVSHKNAEELGYDPDAPNGYFNMQTELCLTK